MIRITRQNTEDFEFEPFHFYDNRDQRKSEDSAGGETVHIVIAEANCPVAQQKCHAGDHLRAVAKRVYDHRHCHNEHEHEVGSCGRHDPHRVHMIQRVRGPEQQGPSATDESIRKKPIAGLPLEENAATEKP